MFALPETFLLYFYCRMLNYSTHGINCYLIKLCFMLIFPPIFEIWIFLLDFLIFAFLGLGAHLEVLRVTSKWEWHDTVPGMKSGHCYTHSLCTSLLVSSSLI